MRRSDLEVMAQHHEPDLCVWIVGEPCTSQLPANGGLRLEHYCSDEAARQEAFVLAERMQTKHRVYGTGFRGAKIVANCSASFDSIKPRLFEVVAELLKGLQGRVYTGCDLNISCADAKRLAESCPFVLAALRSEVDASAATGHGVVGSFFGAMLHIRERQQVNIASVLVHGCGAVGSVVATRLQRAGFNVLTFDRRAEAAELAGCNNVSELEWSAQDVDAVVLCSGTGVVTLEDAARLQASLVVSAANAPLATQQVGQRLAQRGIVVVPDALSSAGAVIVDSVERYNPQGWSIADAGSVYRFVEHLIATRTLEHLRSGKPLQWRTDHQQPCGCLYIPRSAALTVSA